MPYARDSAKELSQSLLRGRNANIEITGLTYGDSTLFIGDRNRPAVYKWRGDTWLPPLSRGRVRNAARDAANKFGDSAPTARSKARIGALCYMGDSTLVVGDTGNGYLLYFNAFSNIGDTSKHIKLPAGYNVTGLARNPWVEGDSVPLIYESNGKTIFRREQIIIPAVYQITPAVYYRTNWFCRVYSCISGRVSFQHSYRSISDDSTSGGACTFYDSFGIRRGTTYYHPIRCHYEGRTVKTPEKRTLITPERINYVWTQYLTQTDFKNAFIDPGPQIFGMTRDNTERGLFVASNKNKAFYFEGNNYRRNNDDDVTYPGVNSKAIAWNDDLGGLYVVDTDNDNIRFYQGDDIKAHFNSGISFWGANISNKIEASFDSALGRWAANLTRRIQFKADFNSGASKWGGTPYSVETFKAAFTGDTSKWNANLSQIVAKFVSGNFTGDTSNWGATLSKIQVKNIQASFDGDTSNWGATAESRSVITRYVAAIFNSGVSSWGSESPINIVPSPNLIEENFNIPSLSPVFLHTDGGSEISRYDAVGFYEFTSERTLSPRARRGDTFSDYEYSFPEVSREPTILGPAIPELLPPTLRVFQQQNQVAAHIDRQAELYEPGFELQVSLNENGPWFEPSKNGDTVYIGDSGGYLKSEGFETIIPNVPLLGTENEPTERPLCYRARRVDKDGERSDWSQPQMVVVKPLETSSYGAESLTPSKLKRNFYGNRGIGQRLVHWSMDDTLGGRTPISLRFLQDTSEEGLSIPLEITGNQITAQPGISGNALFIDGVNNTSFAVSPIIGDSSQISSAPFSTECHIKGDSSAQYRDIIALLSYSTTTYSLEFSYIRNRNNLRIRIDSDSEVDVLDTFNTNLLDDEWHQIGFTFDPLSKFVEVYLDGRLISSKTMSLISKTNIPLGGFVGVGGKAGFFRGERVTGFKFRGLIDEVRIWNRVLTQEEFLYFLENPGGTSSPIITTERLADDAVTERNINPQVLQAVAGRFSGSLTIRGGFNAGEWIDPSHGDFRTHADQDEIFLQKHVANDWVNQIRISQSIDGGKIEVIGDSDKIEIEPKKITVFSKEGNQFFEKTKIEKGKIKTLDEFDRQNFSIGDSVDGAIDAKAYLPQTSYFNQSVTQNTLFTSLNNAVPILNKKFRVNGSATSTGFTGNIFMAEKISNTQFNLLGWNTTTNTSVTLIVNSGNNNTLFTNCVLEF